MEIKINDFGIIIRNNGDISLFDGNNLISIGRYDGLRFNALQQALMTAKNISFFNEMNTKSLPERTHDALKEEEVTSKFGRRA